MAVAKKAELEAVMDTAACLLAAQAMAMDEAISRLIDKDTDEDRRREALDALCGALYVVRFVQDKLTEVTGKVAHLVDTAQGVGSLLLSLSTCDEYEERERDGFHLLALSLLDAAEAASVAEDAARQ